MIFESAWRWKLLAAVGWFFCICFFIAWLFMNSAYNEYYDNTGGITEHFYSGAESGDDKIAVIRVTGVIMEGDGYVKRQIERVADDPSVKAVVLRVDSPGGTVTGSDYILHHLNVLREEKEIPIVVSMGSMAASGGYYVAMAVGDVDDEPVIYAEPTTTTGSIGVIIPHYDLTGLMKDYNIKDDSIASGPHKQMLSMTKTLGPEEREILDAYIDSAFTRFKAVIKEGRPYFKEHPEKLDELATGRIFTAPQAKESGLVDEIGYIEDAIEQAAKLADIDVDDARVIRYTQPESFSDLLSISEAHRANSQLETILELSAPRAYYLATSLPTLAVSKRADETR